MINVIIKVQDAIEHRLMQSSSERYIAWLRKKGCAIGEGTCLRPKTCNIDTTRPSLVTIGRNCYINEHFTLLTHDWVTQVFINTGRNFINSSGGVIIGDNVSFGQNVTVLKGVTIGNNCFIGAGSIVTRNIPANSIAVGAPCKVIMSLEEYYQKRIILCEEEAFEYARSILKRYGRKPVAADFKEEFPLFVSGDEIAQYPEIPFRRQLGPTYDKYIKNHKAKYHGLDDFLRAAGC